MSTVTPPPNPRQPTPTTPTPLATPETSSTRRAAKRRQRYPVPRLGLCARQVSLPFSGWGPVFCFFGMRGVANYCRGCKILWLLGYCPGWYVFMLYARLDRGWLIYKCRRVNMKEQDCGTGAVIVQPE